jgi:hypothetical protein
MLLNGRPWPSHILLVRGESLALDSRVYGIPALHGIRNVSM